MAFDESRRPQGERKFDHNNKPQGERKFASGDKPQGGRRFGSDNKPHGERKSGFGHKPQGDRKPSSDNRTRGGRPNRSSGGKRPPVRDMKPKYTARDAALHALNEVVSKGAYASQAIDRALTFDTLSPEDKRLATGIFYTAVENRNRIKFILSSFVHNNPSPVVNDVLHIACAQLLYLDRVPDHAVVDEAVKQVRRMKGQEVTGFVNGVLRSIIRARDDGSLPVIETGDDVQKLSIEYSVSEDLSRLLIEAFGYDEAAKICACRERSDIQTVRCNMLTSSDEELEAYLNENNIEYQKGNIPHAYVCRRAGLLADTEAYRKGRFSIQGQSAMLAGYAMEVKAGMNVLDACAAPGGKSALMCEQMSGTGRVYAWDIHDHRVNLIRAMAHRLKLYNLRPIVRDATEPYEPFESFMDAVLIDAPCSGLGVMSDKPDIRLKFTADEVKELTSIQEKLLNNCSKFVKVGGLLVYSTCTILPQENEERIKAFLNENPNFALDESVDYLPDEFKSKAHGGILRLMQHSDGVEGFFIARMRRKF